MTNHNETRITFALNLFRMRSDLVLIQDIVLGLQIGDILMLVVKNLENLALAVLTAEAESAVVFVRTVLCMAVMPWHPLLDQWTLEDRHVFKAGGNVE